MGIYKGQKKAVSLILIAIVFVAAVIAPSMTHVYPECRTTQCFLNFDECQSMGTGALSDSDSLFIPECASGIALLPSAVVPGTYGETFSAFNVSSQVEHPPRA